MNAFFGFLVALCLTTCTLGQQENQKSRAVVKIPCDPAGVVIEAPQKEVHINKELELASLEGRWRKVDGKQYLSTLPKANSVSVFCDQKQMGCVETLAAMLTSLDSKQFRDMTDAMAMKPNEIDIRVHHYKVVAWTAETIVAVKEMPVAYLEIRINPVTEKAERVYREKDATSVFNHYVLE